MSKINTIAEAMAERLNAEIYLQDVVAVVSRQKDLASTLQAKVLKAGGAAIVIQFEGFSNPSANSPVHPTVTRRYTATIYTKPIMREGETPADDIVEFVASKLHDWEITADTADAAEVRMTGGDVIPDRNYLIYQLDLEVLSRL
jgi:hypothetical protein